MKIEIPKRAKFSFDDGPSPKPLTAIEEAAELERRAELARDPDDARWLRNRAECFRKLANPEGFDWDLQAERYHEEIEDRLKALDLLKGQTFFAKYARRDIAFDSLTKLEGQAIHEDGETAEDAFQSSVAVAALAADTVNFITRNYREKVKPITRKMAVFPTLSNKKTDSKESVRDRQAFFEEIELGKDFKDPGVVMKRPTDLDRLASKMLAWIKHETLSPRYHPSIIEKYKIEPEDELEKLFRELRLADCNLDDYLTVALEALDTFYRNRVQDLPKVSGVNPNAGSLECEKERKKICQKWRGILNTESHPELVPPTWENYTTSEKLSALTIKEGNAYKKDAQNYAYFGTQEASDKIQFNAFKGKFSARFREYFLKDQSARSSSEV